MEIPWAGGIASARGLARIYSVLASGGRWGSLQFCRPETLERLRPRGSFAIDDVLRKPIGYTLGFVKEEEGTFCPHPESFGHPGAGGVLGWADPVSGVGVAYVMNRMDHRLRSPRCLRLCRALFECMEKGAGRAF